MSSILPRLALLLAIALLALMSAIPLADADQTTPTQSAPPPCVSLFDAIHAASNQHGEDVTAVARTQSGDSLVIVHNPDTKTYSVFISSGTTGCTRMVDAGTNMTIVILPKGDPA